MELHEKLETWMRSLGYTNSTLAADVGVSYELIYKLVNNQAAFSNGFRWKFAQKFGYETANRVLSSGEREHEPA